MTLSKSIVGEESMEPFNNIVVTKFVIILITDQEILIHHLIYLFIHLKLRKLFDYHLAT